MKKRFIPLFITNLLGVLNDNYLKALASFIAVLWVDDENVSLLISCVAAALVLPYIFLSPYAGRLAQRYPKREIIKWAKIAEIPIMGVAILGFILQSVPITVGSILLMGVQSALFSPAKYGLIRETAGQEGISFGVGGMEAVSFLGMLSGMLVAAFLVDSVDNMMIPYLLLLVFAVIGLISALTIKNTVKVETINEYRTINPLKAIYTTYCEAKSYSGLNRTIFVLSVFWWLAASIQIGLLIYCGQDLSLSSRETGVILSLAAVGITLGCFLSGLLFRQRNRLISVLSSGILISLIMFAIFTYNMTVELFGSAIFMVALLSGFFKVPLDASIQRIVKGEFLSIVLGYFNQVSFIFILLASISISAITYFFEAKYMFLMFSVVMLITTILLLLRTPALMLNLLKNILKVRYKIVVQGVEVISRDNNHLFLPNHTSLFDPVIIYSTLYETHIRPFVDEGYVKMPIVGSLIRSFGAIAVPDLSRSRRGVESVRLLQSLALEALAKGDNILLYPSGQLTHRGTEVIGNKQLAHNIVSHLPDATRVIIVKIDGLWGSRFSRYGRNATPPLISTFIKALPSLLAMPKRRVVKLQFIDVTEEAKEWSREGRSEFNSHLEELYKL